MSAVRDAGEGDPGLSEAGSAGGSSRGAGPTEAPQPGKTAAAEAMADSPPVIPEARPRAR